MAKLFKRQRGLGLLELMISITLGLFLLSGAIGVLLSSKSSYDLNNELTWIQDNARFTTTLLSRDIRMAGFFGCGTSTSPGFQSTLNNVAGGTGWYVDFSNAVLGWDGDAAGYPTPEFPDAYNSNVAAGLPSSDLLTVRHTGGDEVEVVDNDPPTSANIDIAGTHSFSDGDVLVITDCEQTTVFQVTGNSSNRLVHNTGAGSPGNCSVFLGNQNCSSATSNRKIFRGSDGAFVVKVEAHAYYVDEAADGTPTLYRRELATDGGSAELEDQELAQGVENIQVLYGYDVDGDGYANRYVDANDVPDWTSVVTVRLHLLMRSFQQAASEAQDFRFVGVTYTPADRFLRQEFIATIELRNKG